MSIPAVCRKCGLQFISGLFGGMGFATVSISGSTTDCPNCGGTADFVSGEYQFVAGVIAAFTAPGMTREKFEAARGLIAEASSGAIATAEAIDQLSAISAELAKAIQSQTTKKVNWEFLVALLALIWTIWDDQESDAVAKAALRQAQTQTAVAQKMLAELQAQPSDRPPQTTKLKTLSPTPAEKVAPPNRHERRKDEAMRRKPPSPPKKPKDD